MVLLLGRFVAVAHTAVSYTHLLHKMLDIAAKSGYVYISSELFRPTKYDKWV